MHWFECFGSRSVALRDLQKVADTVNPGRDNCGNFQQLFNLFHSALLCLTAWNGTHTSPPSEPIYYRVGSQQLQNS